jgi:NAD-dependent SIR2 family protein deacetylase
MGAVPVTKRRACDRVATWVITVLCEKCGATYHSLRCDHDLDPNNCKCCHKGSHRNPAVVVLEKVKL